MRAAVAEQLRRLSLSGCISGESLENDLFYVGRCTLHYLRVGATLTVCREQLDGFRVTCLSIMSFEPWPLASVGWAPSTATLSTLMVSLDYTPLDSDSADEWCRAVLGDPAHAVTMIDDNRAQYRRRIS